ncbi:MAG: signal peptidase I [Candidatus Taylorbacteria bacterium]|nr:signal peptidase I [Candidatus Taylorbacteria bacterium]
MADDATGETNTLDLRKNSEWSFREMLRFAIVAALIVIPIRFFIAEPYLVRQTSMVPTFLNNDYLVVEKISYRFSEPERGDVIIFRSPIENRRTLIKRIVGLPGETIEIDGNRTVIKYSGGSATLKEPYVKNFAANFSGTYTLKADEYFMMGDNRAGSYDSRSWGPIERKDIIGRPFLRLYHFDFIGFWPGMRILPESYPRTSNLEK